MTNEITIFLLFQTIRLFITNGNFFKFLQIHIVDETERHEVG